MHGRSLGVAILGTLTVLAGATALWRLGSPAPPEHASLVQTVPRSGAAQAPPAGRIELDVSAGEVDLRAGEPGTSIALDATYDTGAYVLETAFDPTGDGGWVLRVGLRPRRWLSLSRLRAALGGAAPVVRITVPPDVPFVLAGTMRGAHSEIDLGGTRVTGTDLELQVGEYEIGFDRPPGAPMERFHVDGFKGLVRIRGLGYASPRRVELRNAIGRVELDLGEGWVRDAEVVLANHLGRLDVRLPHGVEVQGITPTPASGAPAAGRAELPAPVLRFDVDTRAGQLRVER